MPLIRGRLRLRRAGAPAGEEAEESFLEIDPRELTGIFAAPQWLRDLGFASWLIVGVAAALAGAVWLAALTHSIVLPVITGAIITAVASPVVGLLQRLRIPRAAGAGIVLLALVALGIGVGVVVLTGISSQSSGITTSLTEAVDKMEGWLRDIGVSASSAADAGTGASASISDAFQALTRGLAAGIDTLASLAVFLTFTVLSTFFLLKDGPTIQAFAERHLGVPVSVGHTVLTRTAGSLRGYFAGVTVVAAFSATVVGLGALAIGAPIPGTIAAVTFVGGYIPYIGAWTAGAFAVLITLGGESPEAALAIAVISLLANGILQQMVQPIAYGATLQIHPLAVLIVTIAGGALFGTIGLILSAPLTSAAVKISADLARARQEREAGAESESGGGGESGSGAQPGPEPGPEPSPA